MDHRFDDLLFEQDLESLQIETVWEQLRTNVINRGKQVAGPQGTLDRIPDLCQAVAELNAFESEHPQLGQSHEFEYGVDPGAPGGDKTIKSLWTSEDAEELSSLRREMDLSSLGDRPQSIAVKKLKRLIDLEALEPPYGR